MAKYILLEDVQKILDNEYVNTWLNKEFFKTKLNSLPSISPVETIKEMIGKNELGNGIDYSEDYCKGLEELLQKFKS